ncbi:glycosyltransferase [Brucella pituitosa]|uniref:glycosyltransferase n=1 Tax=Brucella pituitosa TaxID=571256 RepID=UPI0009A21B60|nr:glycosyltransferase [Brucella pituitosa]
MYDLEEIKSEPWPEEGPIIGIYGKAGRYKGTFELLQALQNLADYGLQFRFVITLVGWRDTLSKVIETIASSALRQRTRILPPLPLWKIPEYLVNCDIVAFLENNFPIQSHTPRVPLEIISSGKTLLITREQCEQIGLTSVLQHNVNALIAEPHTIFMPFRLPSQQSLRIRIS